MTASPERFTESERVVHRTFGVGTVIDDRDRPKYRIQFDMTGDKCVLGPFLQLHSAEPSADNDNHISIDLPPMHRDPFSPDAAGGLLADISRWITSTAIIPTPELSLVSAAALLAGLFGKRALGPTGAGVNLYLTTLLATAGGKGHPPKAIRTLADKVGGTGAVTNGDPTSYAAIEANIRFPNPPSSAPRLAARAIRQRLSELSPIRLAEQAPSPTATRRATRPLSGCCAGTRLRLSSWTSSASPFRM